MAVGESSLLIVLSSLIILGCIVEFIVNWEFIVLFLAFVVVVFIVKPKPLIVLLLSQAYCFAMFILSYSYVSIPIYISVSSLSTVYYVFHSTTSDPRQPIIKMILVFIPLYIIQPRSLVVGLSSILSLSFLIIMEQLKINRSRVSLLLSSPTVYLDDYVSIIVDISSPGVFEYNVLIDDKVLEYGKARDRVLANIKVKATGLGVHKQAVRVLINGGHRLARVQHGPFTVEYTVTPRFMDMYRKAERIIKEYQRYLSVPLILKSTTLIQMLSREASEGVISPGISLEYPVVDTYSRQGKKYTELAGSGGGGDEYQEKPKAPLILDSSQLRRGEDRKSFELKFQWKIPSELLHKIIQESRPRLGEYVGLREFQPGDFLKLVHWKRSLRKADDYDLVIKVFSSSDIDKPAKKSRHIIIADLVTTSSLELDLLLQTLYGHVLSSAMEKKRPELTSEFYIYITTPRGTTYLLAGKALDVLLGLNHIILEEKINALYDYNSWDRPSSFLSQEPTGVLQDLLSYYEAYGNAIVRDLKSRGIERGVVVLIYSKALSFKYHVVSHVFSRNRYVPTIPTKED
ncbi:MAG: DUF58 domain-containing protein [Desulfurococcaceae archaeon]